LAREVVGWKWLRHENILPFVGVTPELAIVSDLMEHGNIMEFTKNHPRHNRLHLLMGAAIGLEYIHNHGIVHGDLKGSSILVNSRHSACIADFGLAMIIDESTIGSTTGGHELRGTTRWMAPEMLIPEECGFSGDCQRRIPSTSTDIYALGMTILEVITGKRPFDDIKTEATVVLEIMSRKKPGRPPSGFSDALWDLLLAAWDTEHGSQPPKRPSIQTILNQLQEDANTWDQFIILPTPEQEDESCTSPIHLESQVGPLRQFPYSNQSAVGLRVDRTRW
ncbi:kinase-like protein, partial [Thelephora ganbajun]